MKAGGFQGYVELNSESTSGPSKIWNVKLLDDSFYSIRNNTKFLTADKTSSARLTLENWTDGETQKWDLKSIGDNMFNFIISGGMPSH